MPESNELVTYSVQKNPSHWDDLKKRPLFPSGGVTDWGMKTLRAGLDGHVGTVLLEPRYICKDHRNLFSNFYSKKTVPGSSVSARLHFFQHPDVNGRDFLFHPEQFADTYMGYSVIRDVSERCLGRTIIDPYKVGRKLTDGFYSLRTSYRTHLNGRLVTAHGYPYLSQDTDATVCAHATLWGVCRYLSERHSNYAELLPYDLVRLTATTTGRVIPYRGMTYQDYSKILSDFGCHPVIFYTKDTDSQQELNPADFKDLYSYVESGLPVLASFGGHVVALIGHTIDYDRPPKPDADLLVDSSAFLKQFIVVDDNFFPYQLLGYPGDPVNYANNAGFPKPYSINSIITVVCPLPEKVYLPAVRARELTHLYLKDLLNRYGRAAFGPVAADEPLVCRLFVTTGSSLKKRKLETAAADSGEVDQLCAFVANLHLPHFVWMLEISPLSRYRQGQAAAEIVLDATANRFDKHAFVYARAGAHLLLDGKHRTFQNAPVTFAQFTHNLGEA